jgi:hypothetical protein
MLLSSQFLFSSAIASVIFAVPFFVVYYPLLVNAPAGYPVPRPEDVALYSFQLKDFINPSTIPFIYGFDFLAAAIAAVALFRGRGEYRFWLAGALFFLVLSLGPFLQPLELPMPFSLAGLVPALAQFRTPYRLVMPAQIGLAVTAGFALAYLFSRVNFRSVQAGMLAVLFALRVLYAPAVQPFAVQTYTEYVFYHQLASQAGDFSLLEIPFGVRSGLERIGDGGERFQVYQHIHGKRLLNGSMARVPSRVFEFYRSHPVLLFFTGQPMTRPRGVEQDFSDVLIWSKARYVIVHLSYLQPAQAAGILAFLDQQPVLERLADERDIAIYRVRRNAGFGFPSPLFNNRLK